ncbi:Protein NTR-2 [Aphelenchoides avenae]|nr:Protein NTR-2 [Aphelenchus avenae]
MSFHTRDYLNRLRSLSPSFQNQSSKFDKKRIQTIRLTLTIIACNFFLWAPFCLVNIIQAFAPSLLDAEVITYIVILGNLNSCCNPWIYLIFNRKFTQRALCSLVPWRAPGKCRDRSSLSYQSSRKYPTWNGKGNESTSPANETMSTAVTAKLIAC